MSILAISKIILAIAIMFSGLELASANNITIDYPHSVSYGEYFEVNLVLGGFPSDIYDVKIDIFGGGKRISKILDGNWKSTNYYVNDAIDSSKNSGSFKLNITEKYEGAGNITVKIRNSKESVVSFSGYAVEISIPKQDKELEETDELDSQNENRVNEYVEDSEKEKKEPDEKEASTNNKITSSVIEEEINVSPVIKLEPKGIKSEKIWKSKETWIKEYSLAGFAVFCLVLLVVLLRYGGKNSGSNDF